MVYASGLLVGDVILSLFTDSWGAANMLVLGGVLTLPAILFFFWVGKTGVGVK